MQFLFYAAAGAVAWIGYKAFLREAERVSARVRKAEREAQNHANGTLEYDPETGEYRVRKD